MGLNGGTEPPVEDGRYPSPETIIIVVCGVAAIIFFITNCL